LRIAALFALPFALVLAAPRPARAKTEKSRVVKKALIESVRIEVAVGRKVVAQASGTVVASAGGTSWILTNAHVVEPVLEAKDGTLTVLVERPQPVRLSARLVAAGKAPEEDLALLAVDRKLPAAAIAAEEDVSVGDDVVVIGAPYGKALSVSSGIVSQLEVENSGAQTAMKTDAPIGYGASGGGVFEVPGGKLVGLVEGYRTARVAFVGARKEELGFDVPMPGETFVAPPTKIRRFLRRAGLTTTAGLDAAPANLKRGSAPHTAAQAEP
jgi:S1-C subfamily serine protease